MPSERLEAKITGRVQGVMFRDFTKRNARKLRLRGTVQNNPDGSVFIVAEGQRDALERLLKRLQRGSLFSRVENVTHDFLHATNEFTSFNITYRNFLDRL